MNIILYRGGMCGDIIAAMIDPTIYKKRIIEITDYDDIVMGQIVKNSRCKLKKFWKYNDEYKINYIEKFKFINQNNLLILSHDTNLSLKYFNKETVQIVCNDDELLNLFSRRFHELHRPHVIRQVSAAIDSKSNFIDDYYSSLKIWQDAFKFEKTLDISQIYHSNFVDTLKNLFPHIDIERAKLLHKKWIAKEQKNIEVYNHE